MNLPAPFAPASSFFSLIVLLVLCVFQLKGYTFQVVFVLRYAPYRSLLTLE
jgi:hypothetical protein